MAELIFEPYVFTPSFWPPNPGGSNTGGPLCQNCPQTDFRGQRKWLFDSKSSSTPRPLPVACILALSALDFILYFTVSNPYVLGGYFFAMIIPKSQICAWNHHHQHAPTFLQGSLNRLLEFFYALHTGVTTNLWCIITTDTINLLDQSKDQSRWQRKDGSTMGELEYSLNVAATTGGVIR